MNLVKYWMNTPDDLRREDREYGRVLTEKDRAYLRGELDLEPRQERHRRFRIRERIKAAFWDFELVQDQLSDADRKRVFRDLGRKNGFASVVPLYAFLFENRFEMDERIGPPTENSVIEKHGTRLEGMLRNVQLLEDHLRYAIAYAARQRGYLATVDVDVELARPEPDEVLDRMLDGEGTLEDALFLAHEAPEALQEFADAGESVEMWHRAEDMHFEFDPEFAENLLEHREKEIERGRG